MQLVITIGAAAALGYALDQWLEFNIPWLTLLLSIIAITGMLVKVIRDFK